MEGPTVKASAVLAHKGWLFGVQSAYDFQNSKSTMNNVALGFSTRDFVLHTNVDDGQEFGGSIYQKVSPQMETGINLSWSSGSNNTRFGIGCKYDLDHEACVRAKINNQSQIGLAYQQRLREGKTHKISLLYKII